MLSLSPRDIAMGVFVPLVWGMGFVFAKAAIEHFPPILLMGFRFLVTSLVLVWFVPRPSGQFLSLVLIAFVASAVQYSLTFTGLRDLDASVAALVVQLEVPFLVLIGALALKETPGARKWLGIALAFVGVALIAGEPKLSGSLLPVLLVVGGAFTWAVGQAMIRALRDISGPTLTAWLAVIATPQLFLMSLIFETGQVEAIRTAQPIVWIAVLYLGLVMTALGYGAWYTLVRRHPVSQVAPFLLLLPVFSVIGAVLFLGEELTWLILLGGAIVIFGVGLIVVQRRPGARDAA